MTSLAADMIDVANAASKAIFSLRDADLQNSLTLLRQAAIDVGRAWSGSNIGYHSTVYCAGLAPKPPNVQFSSEWGLEDRWPVHSPSDLWQIFDHETVVREIFLRAGNPNEEYLEATVAPLRKKFLQLKEQALSIYIAAKHDNDAFLKRKYDQINKLIAPDVMTTLQAVLPRQYTSRDSLAMHQGIAAAPHQCVLAIVVSIEAVEASLGDLERACLEGAAHLRRVNSYVSESRIKGASIFLGHGRSPLWRELDAFLSKKLKLNVDEFNSVPVAGIATPERLSEMLEGSAFAFLIMTAEDPTPEGKINARLNVIHEVGLFQGRLGYRKAIVLLEDGCDEFSNIHGLNQIRFPKGNISAVFEDVRAVLGREKVI
jgi:predicted nucleotide-binding protein